MSPTTPLLTPTEQKFFRRKIWQKYLFEPHENQELALDSEASRVTMACGKKAGKTTTLIYKGLEIAESPNAFGLDSTFIAIISISYDQCRLTFNPLVRKLREAGYQFEVDHARTDPAEVSFVNMFGTHVRIKCYSTIDPDTLRGAKWDMALIDEAAYMDEDIWTGYLNFNIRRCLIATSPHGKNWVYKFYLAGKDGGDAEFFSLNFGTFLNDKMPEDDLRRLKVEAEWCEKHAPYTYKQDFLGEFVEGGDNYFRNYDHLVDTNALPSSSGIIYPPQRGSYYSTGVDLARYRDSTVIDVLNQNRVQCFHKKLPHQDWALQRKEIATIARTYPGCCWIDATGVGQPVFESLQAEDGVNAEPFLLNQNSKLELLTELRIAMSVENGMRLANIKEMLEALSDVVIQRSEAGRDIIGDARGHLPDEVVSLALANWGLLDFPKGKAKPPGFGEVYTGGHQPKLNDMGMPIFDDTNNMVHLKRPGVEEEYVLYKKPMEIIRNGYYNR